MKPEAMSIASSEAILMVMWGSGAVGELGGRCGGERR